MHLLSCIKLFWRIHGTVGCSVVGSTGVILAVYLHNYNWLMLFYIIVSHVIR